MQILLERDEILEDLIGLVESASAGTGSLALVGGEAGSGKTTVIKALIERVGDKALVLRGGCDPIATPRPLGPLHDYGTDPDSGFRRLLEEHTEGSDVFAATLSQLKGTIRPTVMVVEDIQWADEGTLDLLRYLGRRVTDTNALVICTYRDDELGREHPLRVLLGQLTRLDTTRRFSVPPLSRLAVARLAADSLLDPDQLHELSAGNAFYATELIASGDLSPTSVQDAVLARVARLSSDARRVVEAASIAPRSIESDDLLKLIDVSTLDVSEALDSGVLVAEGTAIRFRHELARAAVEASLPGPTRVMTHRVLLSVLEDKDHDDVARLAHHAVRASSTDHVLRYCPQAAREAVRRHSSREAAAFYAAALAVADAMAPRDRADMRLEFSKQLIHLGRNEEASQQLVAAISTYSVLGAASQQSLAMTLHATAKWRMQDREAAEELQLQAVATAEPDGPSEALVHALSAAGYFYMLQRRLEPAQRLAERASVMATELGLKAEISNTARLLACNQLSMGDAAVGLAALQDSYDEAVAAGDLSQQVATLGMLGTGAGEVRRYDVASSALATGVALGVAMNAEYITAYNKAWQARVAFEQGRYDDAVELAESVLSISPDDFGLAHITAVGALGRVRVRRGDPKARELLDEVVDHGSRHELQHVWSPICGLVEESWLAGRTHETASLLEATYQRALACDSPWAHGEIGFWMWKTGHLDGPGDIAAKPFALQMRGEWRASADAWREIGCPYEVGMALADGDEEALAEAVDIFDALGTRPAAMQARALLRERGVRSFPAAPSQSTSTNPFGLTNRQLEVLTLMVQGLSNPEIAGKLFVTKKTVEHHVSAVFSKLGVTSRARAIAAGVQMDLLSK